MAIGPFDRRKKRSRCIPCSASHLKCSSKLPCSNCEKRSLVCNYPSSASTKPHIFIGGGNQQNLTLQSVVVQPRFAGESLRVIKSPQLDHQSYYLYYFDVFLRKNKFSGQKNLSLDVIDLLGRSHAGGYLMDAVLSLGAMEAMKLRAADTPPLGESRSFALKSYTSSVSGLRDALDHEIDKPQLNHNVLWTTLFLGLFELMSDTTGHGWVQHIVHGTSNALVASGPMICQSGIGRRFFKEVKIFEVCRAIIFNQPTFLAEPGWVSLSYNLRSKSSISWHSLDALLDIIVMCSTLRVRANDLVDSLGPSLDDYLIAQAYDISAEGFRLRESLLTWSTYSASPEIELFQGHSNNPPSPGVDSTEGFELLGNVFFAATSIYLSGVFDYEIFHWQNLGIDVSTLGEEDIQIHVKNILELSDAVLKTSNISPVLLLFPLRVAGARSWNVSQQERVIGIIEKIETSFAVAAAFKYELRQVWQTRRFVQG